MLRIGEYLCSYTSTIILSGADLGILEWWGCI